MMESVQLGCAAYTVPTEAPEADGTAEWDATTAVVVHARARGQAGLGWSYTDPAAVGLVTRVLDGALAAIDADDIPAASHAMAAATRNLGRTGIAAAAISAVDIALWDLKARVRETSLGALLGRARSAIPVYGSGGFTSYDDRQTTEQLVTWIGQGIPRVKIKIGESWGTRPHRDLHRIRLARRAVGADVELFVDANGGYGVGGALRMDEAMHDQDVRWFEEPVSSDYPHRMRQVRDRAHAEIAAGEYCWRLSDAAALIEAGAVDCLQIDVTRCGGISEWLRAAALAAGHGLDVSAHCAPQLSAHVAVATPNARHVEFFHDHARLEPLLFDGTLPVHAGSLAPDPDRPGHGMTVRTDAERYRVG